MVKELRELKIELMVSIWPKVEATSEALPEMPEEELLVRSDRGPQVAMQDDDNITHFGATQSEARELIWGIALENYHHSGIKVFCLDEPGPEYDVDVSHYSTGSYLRTGCQFAAERMGWEQRYGVLVRDGDSASSWGSFRNQVAAGLNMGPAGIPWWTTHIGGVHGGNPNDPEFRELFTRWFQWGAFCPVMRLHRDRKPRLSGASNEIWAYGEEVYEICKRYIEIREELRDYAGDLMREAHEKGTPVMRTLFYEFPWDSKTWDIATQYMFGSRYLISPIVEPGQRKITVYLPAGAYWTLWGKSSVPQEGIPKIYQGGTTAEVDCPIETMPLFYRVSMGEH
ncbi:uncharacterized protein N7459_007837 [Penicillium hispanicum]|uniref:uncharacterized protein n=1 Tax=Penicillium hispanicum TaxID=1080232 RepID=UPI00253FEFAC|nr:uncharacterized protein N7459_007837 [Penicillium hispanicum]KAJ5573410.1 hypothetical protein N7459_007837 [Penicillium hispanicum]